MPDYQHIKQPFLPVYDEKSEILILGSLPSVKSRENGFYYGHPQNRFWKMLAAVCGVAVPEGIEDKRNFLLEHRIALWDVIESCDIIGSSDSSIKNVQVNDIRRITGQAQIRFICCNGDKAYRLFTKYMAESVPDIPVYKMPSTSPANAACGMERLVQEWQRTLQEVIVPALKMV